MGLHKTNCPAYFADTGYNCLCDVKEIGAKLFDKPNPLADCIRWALDHGYNPFDSTASLPERRNRLYGALNDAHDTRRELLAALEISLDMLNQLLTAAEKGIVPDVSIGFFRNRTEIIEPAIENARGAI